MSSKIKKYLTFFTAKNRIIVNIRGGAKHERKPDNEKYFRKI